MRAMLMRYGHHPDDIDEYSLRDCRAFMQAIPLVHEIELSALATGGAHE